mmetsp:Transcript_6467/g.10884  ORF Transcript_6467/g.10884 Transcript_6467/m.10884 type:complete len:274 (+) Transcript_6467:228-1049(+)|eukprot:CAMPEP_0174961998 /NCGR_PEP_ID=MMETSP0004_2-20121128/4543_1 /TAXON_ID=420556 /ORGANISM="Ochromonas sp., Strain CCMP1393" /LENGTH=273 /DNA_ID=CAMNT_0016210489 /DNA_START=106 /DNA_END=927 /DNA_ORIENTATION=-
MSQLVFVGNLTWSTTSEQLEGFGNQCGIVVKAEVSRHADTMRSKGWGLITYENEAMAGRAVEELNGTTLNGRSVHVRMDRSIAEESVGNTFDIFVGNLSWEVLTAEVLTIFQEFRPTSCQILTNMYGKSRGFSIIKFSTEADAIAAIEGMNGSEIKGRQIECRFDRGPGGPTATGNGGRNGGRHRATGGGGGSDGTQGPRNSVYVGQLPPDADDSQLANLLSPFGAIESAQVTRYPDGKSRGWGIVKFVDPVSVSMAIGGMAASGLVVRIDRK